MSGALFRAQQQINTMENGVVIAFIIVFIMIKKSQSQVKSLTVNKNRVSENPCDLCKIAVTVAVAQCKWALKVYSRRIA